MCRRGSPMIATPTTRDFDDLLLRWEELHEQGQSLSADELCSTCPELAEELARRIALLASSTRSWATSNTAPGEPGRPPRRPARSSRESATARADFRDLRFHAAGALGEVFMARNAELNREVALKFLKPERSPRPRQPPPLPPGGRDHRPAGAPRHRADLRPGRPTPGAAVLRHALHPGPDAPGGDRRFHAAEKPGRDPAGAPLALRELLEPVRRRSATRWPTPTAGASSTAT